jgi:tetratricopeptide (TPR) repeat protein
MFLLIASPLKAQTKAYCDTLIEKGISAMWKKDFSKSLEMLTEARTIAENKNWEKQQFKAVINIGSNYYAMLDYGEALNNYLESYKIAVKLQEPKYEMLALNNIAILYSEENNYKKASEYFEKAYNTAKEIKDYKNLGLYAANLGNIANQANRLDEAKSYFLEALSYLKNGAEPQLILIAEVALAENQFLRGNTQLARQKAEELLKKAKGPENKDSKKSLLGLIAQTYLKEGNYEQALAAANKILNINSDVETSTEVFRLLADIYTKSKEYDKALQYKDSLIVTEKELSAIHNGRLFENNKVKFEILGYKNQIADNKGKMALERKIFIAIFIIIIAGIVILILIYKQRKSETDRVQHMTALDLEKEKNEKLLLEKQVTESRLEQEVLKNDIEIKNKKLSTKALYLSSRNELIEEVISYLSKKPKFLRDPALSAHVQSLKNHLMSANEWDNFIIHFEEVNEGFLTRLRELHPTLSANDIKFIAYVYMNVSVKEISNVFNITIDAAKKRKERITAKMELPKNKDIYDYILSI